ncbi:unnamed protein product [Moneuplotes crassus]|uniref:Uncharacterized protein n=1 Tax=Euplotes crassus TaxID=5936 RepID=A0AAD1UBQ0_EUPCR|nr:unnamed protein product [Moneuplotes crassus]
MSKLQLFSDNESEEHFEDHHEEEKEIDSRFHKTQLEGVEGQVLLQMQKNFKGDNRFKLDDRFAGDIDLSKNKLSKTVLGTMSKREVNIVAQKKVEDEAQKIFESKIDTLEKTRKRKKVGEKEEVNIETEKDKAFTLLSQIVPASEVFFKPSKGSDSRHKTMTIKRFNPRNIANCKHLLKPQEEPVASAKEQDKLRIMDSSEWEHNKPEINTEAPVVEGPKVVEISSEWQNISKKQKKEEIKQDSDDFVLDFGDGDNSGGFGLLLGKEIENEPKNINEMEEKDIKEEPGKAEKKAKKTKKAKKEKKQKKTQESDEEDDEEKKEKKDKKEKKEKKSKKEKKDKSIAKIDEEIVKNDSNMNNSQKDVKTLQKNATQPDNIESTTKSPAAPPKEDTAADSKQNSQSKPKSAPSKTPEEIADFLQKKKAKKREKKRRRKLRTKMENLSEDQMVAHYSQNYGATEEKAKEYVKLMMLVRDYKKGKKQKKSK